MSTHWLADRTRLFDASGIRKVFDLAAKLKDPINLSIGQPDFDVPEPVRRAAIDAIESRKNGYALTQGMPVLREKLQAQVQQQYGHDDREVFVTCGTSGGLMLALMVLVNPGEEVIVFDPYFVMYDALSAVVGGKVVYLDTYPDFRIDLDRVADAITPRTKAIIFNSPANPTGVVAGEDEVRGLAELAARRNVVLDQRRDLSGVLLRPAVRLAGQVQSADAGGRRLQQDVRRCPAGGWGSPTGRRPSSSEMIKLQQYSFVCAPQPVQWAGAVAMDVDMTPQIDGLPPQTRPARGRTGRRLRSGAARAGRSTSFPKAALGHRHGVRHPGDREAPVADHSRQRLQPPRHPLPHLLRRRRRGDRARDRGAAEAGPRPLNGG